MSSLFTVIVLCAAAVTCGVYALLASPVDRIPVERRRAPGSEKQPLLTTISMWLTQTIDKVLRSRGWVPFPVRDLELAGVRMNQSSLVIMVSSATVTLLATGFVAQRPLAGVLVAILVPVSARFWLKLRSSQRRAAFAAQLESTMQIMSSALRAGHSFPRALDTVSMEGEAPTTEEFARIINENRLGRDLIEAMKYTAERMQSEDFGWIADAVAIQRETGGNLSDVLDRVAHTIRERNELKQQIHALSSEGRISAVVLMALPLVLAIFYSFTNPGFLAPLFSTTIGLVLTVGSAVMYVIGGLWMRALVKVDF